MPQMIFVGCGINNHREVFRFDAMPTEKTHGHLFNAVVGPFLTVRGAKCMVHYADSNPHVRNVAEAERVGNKYAAELALHSERNYA